MIMQLSRAVRLLTVSIPKVIPNHTFFQHSVMKSDKMSGYLNRKNDLITFIPNTDFSTFF